MFSIVVINTPISALNVLECVLIVFVYEYRLKGRRIHAFKLWPVPGNIFPQIPQSSLLLLRHVLRVVVEIRVAGDTLQTCSRGGGGGHVTDIAGEV